MNMFKQNRDPEICKITLNIVNVKCVANGYSIEINRMH